MTTHTPGPWTSYEHSIANIRIVGTTLTNAEQTAIAHLCPTGRPVLDQANANLIAAAPDLLAALKSVLDARGALSNHAELHHLMGDEADKVFAAIDKAEGRA